MYMDVHVTFERTITNIVNPLFWWRSLSFLFCFCFLWSFLFISGRLGIDLCMCVCLCVWMLFCCMQTSSQSVNNSENFLIFYFFFYLFIFIFNKSISWSSLMLSILWMCLHTQKLLWLPNWIGFILIMCLCPFFCAIGKWTQKEREQ